MHSTFCSEMYCASHGRDSPAGGGTELFAMSVGRFTNVPESHPFVVFFLSFIVFSFFVFSSVHYPSTLSSRISFTSSLFLVSLSFPFPLPSSSSLQIPCFSPRLLGNDSAGSSSRNPLRDDKQRRPRIFLSFYLLHSLLSFPRSEFSHYRLKMTE